MLNSVSIGRCCAAVEVVVRHGELQLVAGEHRVLAAIELTKLTRKWRGFKYLAEGIRDRVYEWACACTGC